jgi:hypothetical protein
MSLVVAFHPKPALAGHTARQNGSADPAELNPLSAMWRLVCNVERE